MDRPRILWRMFAAVMVCVWCIALPVRAEECSHHYITMEESATCTTPGMTYEECTKCGHQTNYQNTPKLGHDYGQWQAEQPAGCQQEGLSYQECSRCGYRQEQVIPATGHDYRSEIVEPGCTKEGYTLYTCTRCGDSYREDSTEPVGHRYDGGVLTKEPTTTAMGRITYTCTVCGDSYQETTPKLTNPFVDVKPRDYFYMSVLWAVDRKITQGTDDTHFSPGLTCTRAQVVTFLWRSAGQPEPMGQSCPFTDVPQGSYYRKAVLWAVEQGITAGMDEFHFGPDRPCTRGQVVTFLYRAHGCPGHGGNHYFTDIRSADYYYDAVIWASEQEITSGMDETHFGPARNCVRGQIVTFLYRARNVE